MVNPALQLGFLLDLWLSIACGFDDLEVSVEFPMETEGITECIRAITITNSLLHLVTVIEGQVS